MVTVVCSSRGDLSTFKEHVIKTSGLHNKLQFLGYKNDGEFSLTEIYNRGLSEANNDIVVFMHDDIIIEKNKWAEKITKLFEKNEQYGIIGVAGTKYLANTGKWWEDPKKMYGRVAHTHEGKTWLSSYSDDLGNELEEVVLVDGVFFAINKKRIKNSFNEDVKGFHFYDVNFCVENYLSGVKIGVTTLVRVNHMSIGMTNEKWEENRQIFADKFKNNLPINIKGLSRANAKLKILVSFINTENNSEEENKCYELINDFVTKKHDVTVVTNINETVTKKLKNVDAKLFHFNEPPGFKLGDGKWVLKTNNGDEPSKVNNLYKIKDLSFDFIYVANKSVFDHIYRLYNNTEFIPVISSKNDGMLDYINHNKLIDIISTNEEINDYIKTLRKQEKKQTIKIVSGWSNKGGSTTAFINLTNMLNENGYNTIFYGPHDWHLDKCNAKKINDLVVNDDDLLITHFITYNERPNAKKVILACHEKNLYEVGKIKQYWDEVIFLNERQRDYHSEYNGKYTIIPNIRETLIKKDKTGLAKIAGIIGSFDENKQTHVSIERALNDGCEKIYLFGDGDNNYYQTYIKPLLSDKVVHMGFLEDKQAMYDMIGCVYHSSKSEVACLVKDECESTGVVFYGNDATDNPPITITNDEILVKWLKLLEI
jgi:hypothetical protein